MQPGVSLNILFALSRALSQYIYVFIHSQVFAQIDADGGGSITFGELCEWYLEFNAPALIEVMVMVVVVLLLLLMLLSQVKLSKQEIIGRLRQQKDDIRESKPAVAAEGAGEIEEVSHTSHVTRHTSHVTRHTSHVTRNQGHRNGRTPHTKFDFDCVGCEEQRERTHTHTHTHTQNNTHTHTHTHT